MSNPNHDQSGWVDPLEGARKARIAVAGDVTASASGREVHGDNMFGSHGGNQQPPKTSTR